MFFVKTKSSTLKKHDIQEYCEADYLIEVNNGIYAVFNVETIKDGTFKADVFFSEFLGDEDYKEEIKMDVGELPSAVYGLLSEKVNEEILCFADTEEDKDSMVRAWFDGYEQEILQSIKKDSH